MGRTFACSDLHGIWSLYEQMNKFIRPGDKVIFLGDAADRGPDGWRIIRSIAANPQWTFLKGNHEDMLAKAISEFCYEEFDQENTELLFWNGGEKTFHDWIEDGAHADWIHWLNKLPVQMSYINKDGVNLELSHAGFTPREHLKPITEYELLWDRKHIHVGWNKDWFENTIVVHGHTPIHHIFPSKPHEPGALWYANNQKVCIDNGSFATGFGCLFDLDTFDEHIFRAV